MTLTQHIQEYKANSGKKDGYSEECRSDEDCTQKISKHKTADCVLFSCTNPSSFNHPEQLQVADEGGVQWNLYIALYIVQFSH